MVGTSASGDKPGHEFHGNQYTGQGGRGEMVSGKLTPTEKAVYQRCFEENYGTVIIYPSESKKMFLEEENKLSPKHIDYGENVMKNKIGAYYNYIHTDFGVINRALRGEPIDEARRELVIKRMKEIDNNIENAPKLPGNLIMFRGTGEEVGEGIANAEIGTIIRDKGFQSHSLALTRATNFIENWNKDLAATRKFTILRAITSGKTKGIYQDNYGEMEVTVARGTPWKVLGKEVFKDTLGNEFHLVTVGEV